jgi:sugar phosphate isomerase/epimerase
MNTVQRLSRRHFLQTGIAASAVVVAALPTRSRAASLTKQERDPFHGLKMGITTYTFRKFTLDQAIAMTKEAGAKYISIKDMHLPLKSTAAERQQAHRKVEEAGLTLMGGGVIGMKNNEAEIRAAFDYAKDAGMPTIICSPDPEALDTVEKMAKEYQIRIAIHNHGPGDKKFPSPLDVFRAVKSRDKLMGLCMDVGHTVRIGQEPIEAIEQCAERLYDFHMKDVTTATAKGQEIEVGRGVIDIVGVLKALLQIKYSYHIALEHESHSDNPMPGVVESFAYIRGVLAAV